ncbi:MAG: sugar ABC transporter permease, partial [Cyanobacteria bacterium P01_F01_bin.42]
MIVLSLAVFWPAVQAFFLSFSEFGDDIVSPPSWVGLKNFYRLWRDQVFWQALINTLLYIIFAVPILVFAPLGLAILVNQRLRGIQWFRAAYYTPVVISMVVAGIAWGWLFDQRGLLNTMGRWLVDSNPWVQEGWRWLSQNIPPIQSLNDWLLLSERGIPWLTNPNIVLFCVMVV